MSGIHDNGSSAVDDLTTEEEAALDLARDLRDRVQRGRQAAQALRDYLALPRDVESKTRDPRQVG